MATTTGSPCGACKFLRRKCASDCIFAPYFCNEHGPARFAAIHKVFGASNVSKLLVHVPVEDRGDAVFTIAYEAQARLRDPVYGCVSHIFALQQQVACLQAQLMQAKAQLAHNLIEAGHLGDQLAGFNVIGATESNSRHHNHYMSSINNSTLSPQSSLESIDQSSNDQVLTTQEAEGYLGATIMPFQTCVRKRGSQTELSELQALAFRMMNS